MLLWSVWNMPKSGDNKMLAKYKSILLVCLISFLGGGIGPFSKLAVDILAGTVLFAGVWLITMEQILAKQKPG